MLKSRITYLDLLHTAAGTGLKAWVMLEIEVNDEELKYISQQIRWVVRYKLVVLNPAK